MCNGVKVYFYYVCTRYIKTDFYFICSDNTFGQEFLVSDLLVNLNPEFTFVDTNAMLISFAAYFVRVMAKSWVT